MKKSHILTTLLFLFFSVKVFAADGKISFSGVVTSATCSVTGGNGTTGASGDVEVKLPSISVDRLKGDGDVAGSTPFSLIIGGSGETGCTDGVIASLHIETQLSPMIDPSTGRLKNTDGQGYAKNIQIELLNNNGDVIDLYNSNNISEATISGNSATLNFFAQYRAVGSSVVAGNVSTNMIYSVVYN